MDGRIRESCAVIEVIKIRMVLQLAELSDIGTSQGQNSQQSTRVSLWLWA